MKQFLSLSCITLLLFACAGKGNASKEKKQTDSTKEVKTETKAVAENKLPFIDLNKEYPKKTIKIEDIADIEYIPLETRDDVLLRHIADATITDDLIITSDSQQGRIFFFDRKGKFLNSFAHKGPGPNEYKQFMRYSVDLDAKEVFINDHPAMNRILVYSFAGKFKRRLYFSKKVHIEQLYDYNKDFILCYWNTNAFPAHEKIMPKKPYFLICKKSGKFNNFPLTVENQITNVHIVKLKQGVAISKISMHPMIKSEDKIVISDFALDTIYTCEKEKMNPIAVRNISDQTGEFPFLSSIYAISNRYLFCEILEKRIDEGKKQLAIENNKDLMCDRINGDICIPTFVSSDMFDKKIGIGSGAKFVLPTNYAYNYLKAETLVNSHNENRLSGKLKEIASTLKEDDNPVLMLIKFKE